jgi:hypothetical protein
MTERKPHYPERDVWGRPIDAEADRKAIVIALKIIFYLVVVGVILSHKRGELPQWLEQIINGQPDLIQLSGPDHKEKQ